MNIISKLTAPFKAMFAGRPSGWYFDAGMEAYQNGEYQQALDYFDTYEKKTGLESVSLYFNKAQCYEALAEIDEAEACYKYCLEMAPEDVEALYSMGRFYYDRGAAEKSLEFLIQANAYAGLPGDLDTLVVLGFVYEELGDLEQAVSAYENVLTIDPNMTIIRVFLANIYIKTKRVSLAKDYLPRPEDVDPQDEQLNQELAFSFGRLGNWPDTKTCCQRVIDMDDTNAQIYNQLGLAHYCCEEYESSIEFYKKSLAIQPDFDIALNNLAYTYEKLDMFDEAIETFRIYLKLIENNPTEYKEVSDHVENLEKLKVSKLKNENDPAEESASEEDAAPSPE